jgi:hypothetical protein
MPYCSRKMLFTALAVAVALPFGTLLLSATEASAEIPQAIAVAGEVPATALHAEGAQIYQCEPDWENKLVWRLREPIATLILDDNSVGRHYGSLHWENVEADTPRWEHNDGSSVKAMVVARAPGVTPNDLPWLKFRVLSQAGNGIFYGVTSVQRINTQGGMAKGPCDSAGSYLSVPYSADYVFWRAD